jgi:hypothetical protein
MYSDTMVLSGSEVMLSSPASVAASHSLRPQSAPIGSLGSAAVDAISRVSPLRGAGQLTAAFGMMSATRQRSPLAARRRISLPPAPAWTIALAAISGGGGIVATSGTDPGQAGRSSA